MRLLVVDDDSMLLAGLRRVIPASRRHWQVSFATSSAEALSHMESQPVDAVLTDLYMPHVGGAELLDIVRRRWPHALRVLCSGSFDRVAVLDLLVVAHRALEKPYVVAELTTLLEDSLRVPLDPARAAGGGDDNGNDEGELDVVRLAAIAGMAPPGADRAKRRAVPAPPAAAAAAAAAQGNPWQCLLAMQAEASPLVPTARHALDLPRALAALGSVCLADPYPAQDRADPASLGDHERERERAHVTGIGRRSAVAAALAHEIAGALVAPGGSTTQASTLAHASALLAAVASPALPHDAPIDLVLARSARVLAMRGVHGSVVDTILSARSVSDTWNDIAMAVRLAVDLAHRPEAHAIRPDLHRWLHDAGLAGCLPGWQEQGRLRDHALDAAA